MSKNYKVGKEYKAKSYLECGYNFPEGKYKIKAKIDGFPEKLINHDDELKRAKEHWLEGDEEYKKVYEGIWYYLEFPKDENQEKDHFEWIPEVVMEDVFK